MKFPCPNKELPGIARNLLPLHLQKQIALWRKREKDGTFKAKLSTKDVWYIVTNQSSQTQGKQVSEHRVGE